MAYEVALVGVSLPFYRSSFPPLPSISLATNDVHPV
jgi:hypothetical protein